MPGEARGGCAAGAGGGPVRPRALRALWYSYQGDPLMMTRLTHALGHGSRWESSPYRRAGDSGGTTVCLDSTVSGLQSSTRRAGQRYRKLRFWEAEQRAWDHAAALQQLWTRLSRRALRPRSPHCPRKASSCPLAAAALTQHTHSHLGHLFTKK